MDAPGDRIFPTSENEVEPEHAEERVEQGMNNLGWLIAAPDGRQSEQADQIIDAVLKTGDLSSRVSFLQVHARLPWVSYSDEPDVDETPPGIAPVECRRDCAGACRR